VNELAMLASVLGLATGLISLLGGLWKLFSLVSALQARDRELLYEIEKLALTVNGVRERMEHVNLRISNQIQSYSSTLRDVESWMVKHTEYERRDRGE
jgi:hypothetical protein